jgi:hypothetical protein
LSSVLDSGLPSVEPHPRLEHAKCAIVEVAMDGNGWIKAPGNPAARKWLTRDGRCVLVVVPHMTAGTRLGDLLPLLEADHRIQVLFTIPTVDDAWPGVEEYVRSSGGLTIPWQQALRTTFDLALAASYSQIDRVSAPVLVVPHGAGGGRSRRSPWIEAGTTGEVRPRDLLLRDGRVVPAAVAVAHECDARQLRAGCPEAAERIVLAGDPCLDRIGASVPFRGRYRDALGVGPDQKLVVLSSTWSQFSLFGGDLDVWDRVMTDLPSDEYRVVAALHPNIWATHGRRQVLAWLSDQLASGLSVLPPQEGWRAALVGADVVIGDHGSVTRYGAAIGVPTLVTSASTDDVPDGGAAAALREICPTIDTEVSLAVQVERAITAHRAEDSVAFTRRLTSRPGRSAAILRTTMYRLLGLTEPTRAIPVSPVPLPTLLARPTGSWGQPW